MFFCTRALLLLAALTAAPVDAVPVEDVAAPAAPGDPVLAALIAEALERNPAIRAASASAEAARARPDQATALPDPMFSVAYTNDGWSPSLGTEEMTTLALMWSQALPGPGQRRLRGDVLRAAAKGAEQDVERQKLSTVAAVRRAYYGLVLARELSDLAKEQERLLSEVEESARSRYGVGLGTQLDVLRAQVEVTRVQESLIDQEADVVIRTAELNRLLGRSPDSEIRTDAHLALRPLGRSLEGLIEEGERVSPELTAAAAGIEGGQLTIRLAEKERRPELSLQAGYMNRGGLPPMWQAGVGVSVPRRKRTAAALAEATASYRGADERRQAVALELRLRTQERLARVRALEKIANLYAEGIVPQGRAAYEAALANYQAGRLPFVAVIEALAQLYTDRAAYLRHIANHEGLKAAMEEWGLESTSEIAGAPMASARRMGSSGMSPAPMGPSGGTDAGDSQGAGGESKSMSR